MQAVGFSHKPAQMIALDGVLEERFGSPDEDLRLRVWRFVCVGQLLPRDTQRPGYKMLAVFVQLCYALLTTEFAIFRECIRHSSRGSRRWR